MAEWSRNKVDSAQLNNGNEFDNNSDFTLDEMNAIVNGGLYSQDFSEHLADTPDTTEANNVGTATVSFVDNIVNGKTFKKLKFSNLKGQKGDKGDKGDEGDKGDKGLEYLTVNRVFASRYPIGNIAPYYLNDFNRTPVINDIFSTLCANKYYTTFKIINTEPKQMQSIAEVNIQGLQGIEYLTTNRNFTNEYNIGDTTSINNNEFNRTPVINDIFSTLCANKYYTTFKVLSVSDTSCSCQVIAKVNLQGDGVQDSELIYRETLPTASADSPDFVQTTDGLAYKKSTASDGGLTYSYETLASQADVTDIENQIGDISTILSSVVTVSEV